ncbi:hypothetical protein ND747_22565, partial [Frankia sp. R82]|nr:hypothetical protein [Frankia sp. R82]
RAPPRQASAGPARAAIVATVLARLGDTRSSGPGAAMAAGQPTAADRAGVEAALGEAQQRVAGAIVALADALAALRGPSPVRAVTAALDEAGVTLGAGLTALFGACELPAPADLACQLATRTLDALGPDHSPAWRVGQRSGPDGHRPSPAHAATPAPVRAGQRSGWTPSRSGWTPSRSAESPAAAVVRLMRETQASGADAFRLLVRYVPDWSGTDDLRRAVLATGARPYYRALTAGGAPGVDPQRRHAVLRQLLALYARAGATGSAGASSDGELRTLRDELDRRLAPAGTRTEQQDESRSGRLSPAAAFLAACGPGRPDAARAFGLLARHVPDWSADQDLYRALCRWGASGAVDDRAQPSRTQLATAAERYFHGALHGTWSDTGGPQPADLERVTRRLIALYFPTLPEHAPHPERPGQADLPDRLHQPDRAEGVRLRAATEFARTVEAWIVAAIAEHGPNRRRRRSFGLPVPPLTFTLATATWAAQPGPR